MLTDTATATLPTLAPVTPVLTDVIASAVHPLAPLLAVLASEGVFLCLHLCDASETVTVVERVAETEIQHENRSSEWQRQRVTETVTVVEW